MNIGLSKEDYEKYRRVFYKLGFTKEKAHFDIEDFKAVRKKMRNIEFEQPGEIALPYISLEDVIEMTKKYVNSFLKPQDIVVNVFDNEYATIPSKTVENTKIELAKLNEKPVSDEVFSRELLKIYKKRERRTSIFMVPVNKKIGHAMIGETNKGPMYLSNYEGLLRATPIYAEEIQLGGGTNLLSVGTYMHEITHLLVDRHKRVVENFYNDEFLSIFMEKVIVDHYDKTSNKKFVKASEIQRLSYVKCLYQNKFDYEALKYAQSTFYAGILFDKYSKASDEEKTKIMDEVRAIMLGKSTINDLIEAEKLTLDEERIFAYIDKVAEYQKEYENSQQH